MSGGAIDDARTVVVGGGLAGLAAAHELRRLGAPGAVCVLEAGESVGGRAATGWVEGIPVDHGFQVAFAGYRRLMALARACSIPARDLRRFGAGAVVVDGPRRRHLGVLPPRLGGLGGADAARALRLTAAVRVRPPEEWLAGGYDDLSTEEYLRGRLGLSEAAVDEVVRPLFGAILLDRDLGADSGYFRYLVGVMARGPAVLPTDGLGQIAEWVAAVVRREGVEVRTGARVARIRVDEGGRRAVGVELEGGGFEPADCVILAVDAAAARPLLAGVDPAAAGRVPTGRASMVSASFRMRRPLYRGRTVLLNGAPGDAGRARVDLVCQTSNVNRPAAAAGEHVLLATSVTTGAEIDPVDLPRLVAAFVEEVAPGFPWAREAELVEVRAHGGAQYRTPPGVRRSLPGTRTRLANLLLAGDLTLHPTLEGAVESGQVAAAAAGRLLSGGNDAPGAARGR